MNAHADPPRLARRLLSRALPDDVREPVDGDLLELFRRRSAQYGITRAHLWYWTQVASFSTRFLLERLRDRARRRDGTLPQRRSQSLVAPSAVDFRLAVRMLAKYPVLSGVSMFGMAVAIAIGASVFGLVGAVLDPTLPIEDGDRVVAVQTNRADAPGDVDQQVLHDFVAWRSELTSVRDLGAFRLDDRNLIVAKQVAGVLPVAEMSASGFRVGRARAVLGRQLLDDDEREGRPPVLVIGYREWQRHFAGDPNIIGRTVQLGETGYTVVGVMADDFRFPYNHGVWIPIRLDASKYELGEGPALHVFGRLADQVTLEQAQTQVATIGRRMAATYPRTHEHRRPTILPFARSAGLALIDADDTWLLYALQLGASFLLAVVAANVAALVYARTATRAAEIAVRTALGASRARVIAQLFIEALVLSAAAAAFGLSLAAFAIGFVEQRLSEGPFWFDLALSPALIAYVGVLTLLGGTVVGVLPALKATGRRAYSSLQQLAARDAGMRLGPTWTALIVAQVAICVAILPASIHHASALLATGVRDPGYPAREFLRARIALDHEQAPTSAESASYRTRFDARFANGVDALLQRVSSEPGVSASLVSAYPGKEPNMKFEIEGAAIGSTAIDSLGEKTVVQATVTAASVGLFDLLGAPIIAGRGFGAADAVEGATAVIVDTAFAARIGRGNILGQRMREATASGDEGSSAPWLEIVGVVADPPSTNTDPDDRWLPNVYRAATPTALRSDAADATSIQLRMRVRSGLTPDFTRRLRDMMAAIDPGFQLHELRTDETVLSAEVRTLRIGALSVAGATLSVLLLSVAGIYAMLSFTVAQQRREIGIRVALGANSRRIMGSVFTRASAQLGTGVAVGLLLALALEQFSNGMVMGGASPDGAGLRGAIVLMPIVAAIAMAVGLLAALGPARRGLAVQPVEALRGD